MRGKVWLVMALLLITASCEKEEISARAEEANPAKEVLFGCWIHSWEEDQGNAEGKTYRPCDFKEFPMSRYRHILNLSGDGKCSWLELASNDAHYMKDGIWEFNEKKQELRIMTLTGEQAMIFQVIEIGEDYLKLKNL